MNRDGSKILRAVRQKGFARIHAPDAWSLAITDPKKFIQNLFGREIIRVFVSHVRPQAKASNWTQSRQEADFHFDMNSYLPAHLQILICRKAARDGGDSQLIDTWKVLEQARLRSPQFYRALFEVPQIMQLGKTAWFGPIFSNRLGNFIVAQSWEADQRLEPIRFEFNRRLKQLKPACFRLQPQEMLVVNNQRMLHARTAFKDRSRHLLRLLVWFKSPLPSPRVHRSQATRVALQLERRTRQEPQWIRERLGIFSAAQLQSRLNHDLFDRAPDTQDVKKQLQLMMAYLSLNGHATEGGLISRSRVKEEKGCGQG